MTCQEPGPRGSRKETQILRVGLARDRQPGRFGDPPDLGLREVPERESHPRKRRRRQRREHVRLILGRIGRDAQQWTRRVAPFRDPRVVTRGQVVGAETRGEVEHRVEANVAVAAHARVGGLSGGERGDERLDHAGAELVAEIDREVWKAHRVRQRPRLRDRGGRAAAALGVVLVIGPQLERDRDGLAIARALKRRHRAIDAAAHRDERAAGVGPTRSGRRRQAGAVAHRGP